LLRIPALPSKIPAASYGLRGWPRRYFSAPRCGGILARVRNASAWRLRRGPGAIPNDSENAQGPNCRFSALAWPHKKTIALEVSYLIEDKRSSSFRALKMYANNVLEADCQRSD